MAKTLTKKTDNYLYAPGIATYGIDGKTGDTGEKGTAIFYSDYNFTSQSEGDDDLETMLICIKQQRCLIKAYASKVLSRPYIDGDYVICSSGEIYKMKNVSEINAYSSDSTYKDYFTLVGKIDNTVDDKVYFTQIDDGTNDRIILKSDYNGLDIAQSSFEFDQSSGDYVLRIGASMSSIDGLSKALALVAQNNISSASDLKFWFDTNTKAWHIYSDEPIVIDSPVVEIKDSADAAVIDNYTQVETAQSSITSFYNAAKLCKWSLAEGEVTITVSSDNVETAKAAFNAIKTGSSYPLMSMYYDNGAHALVQLDEGSFDSDALTASTTYDESGTLTYVALVKNIEVFITKG